MPLTPSIQPALVEQARLHWLFQQSAQADPGAPPVDRPELARRALESLLLPASSSAVSGDALSPIGIDRRSFQGALPLDGGHNAGLQMLSVRDRGGALQRRQLSMGSDQGPQLSFNWLNIDRGFTRFQDLTPDERSWAGAMRGMQRLELGAERLAIAGGRSQIGLLDLTDGSARARRMSLGFTGTRWSGQALFQRVDQRFQRLGDLADADKKLFGSERGIDRNALDLGYALTRTQKLAVSTLRLRAAGGTAERQQFEYQGNSHLQLRWSSGRVGSKFDQVGTLLDADKNALAPQKGTRWSDLSATIHPARWLTVENEWYRGISLDTGAATRRLKNNWTLQLAPHSRLTLLRSWTAAPSGSSARSQTLAQSFRLEQSLWSHLSLTAFGEADRSSTLGAPAHTGRQMNLQLNTTPGVRYQGGLNWASGLTVDGQRCRTFQWNLALPLTRGLSLQAKADDRLDGSPSASRSLALGLSGPIAQKWNLQLSAATANPVHGPGSHDVGGTLTFTGLRNSRLLREARLLLTLGDTLGLPSSIPVVPKPASSPPPPSPTSSSAPPSIPAIPGRRLHSLALEGKLLGQPVALGYALAQTAGGLTYHWGTDPKRRLQLEALREVRDLGHTSLVARQRYALRERLGSHSLLALSREWEPELSPGKLLPGHVQTKLETQTRLARLDLAGSVAWDQDEVKNSTGTLTSFSLGGSLDANSSLKMSYTDRSHGTDPALPAHDLSLSFVRKPDELLQAAFTIAWRAWGDQRRDDLEWQLDCSAVF